MGKRTGRRGERKRDALLFWKAEKRSEPGGEIFLQVQMWMPMTILAFFDSHASSWTNYRVLRCLGSWKRNHQRGLRTAVIKLKEQGGLTAIDQCGQGEKKYSRSAGHNPPTFEKQRKEGSVGDGQHSPEFI